MEHRFESEIEPCCLKQYVLFGYLKEFGDCDTTPNEFEKRALNLIGSPEEQEMVLSRFSLKNKLFEMLSTNKKYMEAYQVGIGSGLVKNSIELLSENLLLKNLNREQGIQLNMLCKFLQAEHIATNPWPRTKEDGRIHKVLRAAVGRGSSQINSFVKMWEDINRALDSSARRGTGVEMGKFRDVRTAGYVDILVCPYKCLCFAHL